MRHTVLILTRLMRPFARSLPPAVKLTGRNSIMDFGLWILLAVLITAVFRIWFGSRR